jgi:WD40 repeat protein
MFIGGLVRTLTGHSSSVYSFSVLKNGYLASSSQDQTIKIWNANNGSLIRTLTGHTDRISSLSVLENGFLASASQDLTIKIWDPNNASLIRNITGHNYEVTSLAVLQSGYLACGSLQEIKIYNTENGSLIRNLKGNFDFVSRLVSPVKSLVVLKNGYLAVLSNGSHMCIMEQHETINNLILLFLNDSFQ